MISHEPDIRRKGPGFVKSVDGFDVKFRTFSTCLETFLLVLFGTFHTFALCDSSFGLRQLRMLANMKFIGNLFLRQLLSIKVIGQAGTSLTWSEDVRTWKFGDGRFIAQHLCINIYIYNEMLLNSLYTEEILMHCGFCNGFAMAWKVVKGLIGIQDGNALPKDHMIECACELLQAIGSTVDSDPWSS